MRHEKNHSRRTDWVRNPSLRHLMLLAPMLGAPFAPCSGQTTPEAAVRAFFDAGSGTAGTQRLDSLVALFVRSGRIITVLLTDSAPPQTLTRSPAEYVESARDYLATETQYEVPTRFWVEQYANVGQVFCAFETRREPDGEAFYRGIASFQLLFDGERWRIVTAFWQGERPGEPLPMRYRP